MKTVYIITEDFFGVDFDNIKVGDKYILVERTNINTGKTEYKIRKDNGEGIPGNMDASVKRYHGWRGTTDNISVYAYGLREIERIYYVKDMPDGTRIAKVKLSKVDFAAIKP